MAETAFGIGAFCVAAAIIGGGLRAAHIWQMPVVDSVPRQVMLGVFGVAMMALGLFLDGGAIGDANGNQLAGASDGGTSAPATSPGGAETGATQAAPTAAATTPDGDAGGGDGGADGGAGGDGGDTPAGCEITIANPLALLREEPANFAQEIGEVPAGTYAVSEIRNVDFGPTTDRWLQITVEGRTGWVKDDTFTVESKTAACP